MIHMQEKGSSASQKRIRQRMREKARDEAKKKEEEERRKIEQRERELYGTKLVFEAQRKATQKVLRKMKSEICLKKKDTKSLFVLYEYYTAGSKMNRAEWLNCAGMLGLENDILITKADLEMFFRRVIKDNTSEIDFKQFCTVMGIVAQRTHPGRTQNAEDHSQSKCLERLLADLMIDRDNNHQENSDPSLDPCLIKTPKDRRKVKSPSSSAEKARRKAKKSAKKRRERETQKCLEEVDEVERAKKKADLAKVEEARKEAVRRIIKKRKEKFHISEKNLKNLKILYDHFQISPSRMMKRADWLNCIYTLGIQDNIIIQKIDSEEIFDQVCIDKARGITVAQFGIGMSLLALRKYKEGKVNQTKALAKLIAELKDES